MTDFLIKSTLSMGVLLAVYHLFLEREKMHRFNRFYLLFCLVFSLTIPFLEIPVKTDTYAIVLPTFELNPTEVNSTSTQEAVNYPLIIIWSIYSVVTLLLATRFVLNVAQFIKSVRNNKTIKYNRATIVLLNKKVLPHTFLNYIFLNKEDYENRTIEEELYIHELTHVNQKHTLDILFAELLKTLLWFNPLLYLYKKAIQLNHEFLADESVINTSSDTISYQNLLLTKASGYTTVLLASNLNFSITKKRLIMMTKTTPRLLATVKQFAILPVFAGLLLISCSDETQKQDETAAPVLIENENADNVKTYNMAEITKRPEYPGGMAAFYKYIGQEFEIPEVDEDMTARIYVSFVVEKDGSMTDIKVLRDPGHGLGDEALRVLKGINMKWNPGENDGKPVRTSYTLPIAINTKS